MIKIAYRPDYVLPLPKGHKFPMDKYELVPRQLLHEGLFSKDHFFAPEEHAEAAVAAVHDAAYIQKLKEKTLSRKEERRIGFPLSDALLRREYMITNGTMQAALYAREYGAAFNIAGGTHHAFTNKGEGFCIFNDIAVAARHLLNHGLAQNILIIDLDVHQGNGTAQIFRQETRVFTFSMHGAHNYPLQKEQSDLDVPLPDGTTDTEYLNILQNHLNKLLPEIRPDFLFYLAGVDILDSDKFGKMKISLQGSRIRDEMVFETAYRQGIPIATSMGGGYSQHIRQIVEAHANTYRAAEKFYC